MNRSDGTLLSHLILPLRVIVGAGENESVSVLEMAKTNTSYRLRVSVSGDTDRTYFVKTGSRTESGDSFWNLCVREVRFYEYIQAVTIGHALHIPQCHGFTVQPDDCGYFIVLDDVTDTHTGWQENDFTEEDTWKDVIASLAEFHVTLTQHLSRVEIHELSPDETQVRGHIESLNRSFCQFRDDYQGRIDAGVFALLERSIPVIEAFEWEKLRRFQNAENITITHGDLHLRNAMYPKKKGDLPLLVDWQFWGVGVGVLDLRHLIGSGLPRSLRSNQKSLVECYYDLLSEDVKSVYSWANCWTDYRKGIVDNLFMPVWQYAGFGWGCDRWKGSLQRAVENFYELGCNAM